MQIVKKDDYYMEDIEKLKERIKSFWPESLPELNRMVEEDIDADIIEAVLKELVDVAVDGQIECAGQAQVIIAEKYRPVAEKRKSDIIKWIFEFTEKYSDDPYAYFLGFNLVLKLEWKELYVPYIKAYDEQIKKEFDDDYIRFYELEQYLSDNT